jgi:hypothetical protein
VIVYVFTRKCEKSIFAFIRHMGSIVDGTNVLCLKLITTIKMPNLCKLNPKEETAFNEDARESQ